MIRNLGTICPHYESKFEYKQGRVFAKSVIIWPMSVGLEKLRIIDYLDYRRFLQDFCTQEKLSSKRFSNRVFAKKAGLPPSSASFLSKVISGKRKLTQTQRLNFAQAMELGASERQYWDLLVQFNQAKSMAERNHFFTELAKYRGSKAKTIGQSQYRFFDNWYYQAVWAFVGMRPGVREPEIIARNLNPKISAAQVSEALKCLESLALVKKTANGYRVTERHISTEKEIHDLATRRQILEMNRLGMEMLDQVNAKDREYNSLTMYLSKKGFEAVKERILSFREELRDLVERDTEEDRIYTLCMQLFPNSNISDPPQ